MRRVVPITMPSDLALADVSASLAPDFRWVCPTDLLVDDVYQRSLSRSGIRMIRKIAQGWDWAQFKPPVCAPGADGLHVIDGQHTAIAAATLGLATIPVMVVQADDVRARAVAFVGQNSTRVALTSSQLHRAAVAAGHESALDIAMACERAGCIIRATAPQNGVWQPGETMAVKVIGALIARRFVHGARRVLDICVRARLAPVSEVAMRAVEALLFGDWAGQISDDVIVAVLRHPDTLEQARLHAVTARMQQWRALAVTVFRRAEQ